MKTRILLLIAMLTLLSSACLAGAAETFALPADTRDIQAEAFMNCTSLEGTLAIPGGVLTIGPYAFAGCTGFSGLPEIPDSVQSIGAHAFDGCSGLSGTLYLSEDIDLDETAFVNCPNLTVIRGVPPMRVALIVDGAIDGGDMNQACYDAVSAFCDRHSYDCSVYSFEDEGAVDKAIKDGYNVVIMPGFLMADALIEGAESHPNVKFIGLDFSVDGLPANAFTATYREEQAGFMAGYAAVRLGYRHLGFLGGMDIPSVNNYGYGFVQGADVAARQLGVEEDVLVEYQYAGTFAPNAGITAHMRKWFDAMDVEVVFSCGGGIWGAVGGATVESGKGKLIGVDVDQVAEMDRLFGSGVTVTSAVKDLGVTLRMALKAIDGGDWSALAGQSVNLGVVSEDPGANHVALAPSTRFGAGFTASDYASLVAGLYNGTYAVSTSLPETEIAVRREDPVCVAVIADQGGVGDQGFNQAAYEGAQSWCGEVNWPLRAYVAEEDDDAPFGMAQVEQAVASGFDVFVLPGFAFSETIAQAQSAYPGARFIGLDIDDLGEGVGIGDNTFLATYREEQAGFLAGFAAVKLGYRHLGFIGGFAVPSVVRYGHGFVQGADAAASALGIADKVVVEFSYADAFWPSDALTNRMRTWYAQGVEVVFSCGGGIWSSVSDAAAQADGAMVIGVDVDQASQIGAGRTLTSAIKGLDVTVIDALDAIYSGEWASLGGTRQRLGIVNGSVPQENYVQLAPSTLFSDGFTRQHYAALMNAILNGGYAISDAIDDMPETAVRVNQFEAADRAVAIVTGTVTQSEDERRAAEALQRQYNIEEVQLATYPENFVEGQEVTARIISDFGDDPVIRTIIICQAVPGTVDGFEQVKAKRNDVLCLAGEPQEDIDAVAAHADLVVTTDPIARGYLMIRSAKALGCDTFVHLSFPRHLEIEGIAIRLAVLKAAGAELDVDVVEVEVKDPVGKEGLGAALADIDAKVPLLLDQYGQNTAFLCTNDGQTKALLAQLLARGGYFIEADMPSPTLGYPEALQLDLGNGDYAAALETVENAVVAAGGAGRFGTWAYSYTGTLVKGLFSHALNVMDGESEAADLADLCAALGQYSPSAKWNGSSDGNIKQVYQDTYIMGNPGFYMHNDAVAIPEQYYNLG